MPGVPCTPNTGNDFTRVIQKMKDQVFVLEQKLLQQMILGRYFQHN